LISFIKKLVILTVAALGIGYVKYGMQVLGIYRITIKAGFNNRLSSSIQGIMKRFQAKEIELLVFEPTLEKGDFFGPVVFHDLCEFKKRCDLVITNRMVD